MTAPRPDVESSGAPAVGPAPRPGAMRADGAAGPPDEELKSMRCWHHQPTGDAPVGSIDLEREREREREKTL